MFVRNLLGLLFAGLLAAPAFAQFQPQVQQQPLARPTISPYLNLLRNNGNNSPYLNYYGLVQPQLQQQQNALNLQQQITGLQNSGTSTFPGTGSELSTGKIPGYFTHRGYFLNHGGNANYQQGLAGQISTAGNNSVFQLQNAPQQNTLQNQPQSTIGNGNIMPFQR